jgi:soluble lytic murein transglycosylase-like protein
MVLVIAATFGGLHGHYSGQLSSGRSDGTASPSPSPPAPSADQVRPAVQSADYTLRSFSTPAPSPALTASRVAPAPSPSLQPAPITEPADLIADFSAGYRAAGGPPDLLDHLITVVIPCESHWNPLDQSDAGQLGLLQFDPDTWRRAARAGADWRVSFEQGWAGATWINAIAEPGGSGGWRVCWW